MKSFEVIKEAVDEPGVKAVAGAMKLSPGLVYKWCEPPADENTPDASGSRNPLDRVRDLYMLTKDIRLIRWLCNEAGGFFVANPPGKKPGELDKTIVLETQTIMRDFSELLDEITAALENDPKIDADEAIKIRQRWEDLKGLVEGFVVKAEKGHFR